MGQVTHPGDVFVMGRRCSPGDACPQILPENLDPTRRKLVVGLRSRLARGHDT